MTINPKSLKNLKPAKKGDVRNPKGKEKGTINFLTHIKNALDREMAQIDPMTKEKTKRSIRETIVYQHIALALKGDLSAIKELYDREIGRVPASIDLTTGGEALTQLIAPARYKEPEEWQKQHKK